MRILFVYSRQRSFVDIDLALLRERWEVREWAQPGRYANPLAVLREVRRADLVLGWFASWHTFMPLTFARMLGKPSLLVTGGFDTANVPQIGYGYQQGGARRWLARWIIRSATKLITNSEFARREVLTNAGVREENVTVVYHGIPDVFGELPTGEREPLALTVANVAWLSFERKGLRPFVQTARLMPDLRFVLVGEATDTSANLLRELGGANVQLTGGVSDETLADWYRRAAVYVQASHHEGFGMAVAEAMLGGCIPVVTKAGALPEVVGDVGVQVDAPDPESIADGIRAALALPDEERLRARKRVLERFPISARRDGLYRAVEDLVS
jgi:glycosyltransferase involved in cell wall biosynthesis